MAAVWKFYAQNFIVWFYPGSAMQLSSNSILVSQRSFTCNLLQLCGDIETNPGPVKHPCQVCKRPVAKSHRAMECDDCQKWTHIKCATITPAQNDDFMNMKEDDLLWQCHICKSPDGTTDLPPTNEATAASQDLPSYNTTTSRYCDLTVMSVNCNSLVSHSKQAQLLQLIDSHSPDIICG